MLERILPRSIDNTYRGNRVALWLFVPILVMKTGIAFGTIFNGRNAAQGADGIPLDTLGVAGAQAVIAMFAAWGLAQVVISFFGWLALFRYRAMIPLMFIVLLVEHALRRWIFYVKPIARSAGAPGLYINLALLAVMLIGLALSLTSSSAGRTPDRESSSLSDQPVPRT